MTGTLTSNKAQRLAHIWQLFMDNPRGFTTAELARRCGVTQRTIQRDLLDLQEEPLRLPLLEEDGRYKVLQGARYSLPPIQFELDEAPALLESAWGIKYGDELEEVVLRFSPAVTRRVHESVWHPSQEIVDEPAGGCRLTVRVAHPDEMRPWIRGWGADCVVLAPAWLREEIAAEMRRAAEGYGV